MPWWSVANRSRPMCLAAYASNRPACPEKGLLPTPSERCVFNGVAGASGASEKADLLGPGCGNRSGWACDEFYTYPHPTPYRDVRHRAGAGWRRGARCLDPALVQRSGRRPGQPPQTPETAKLRPGQLRPAATARSDGDMINAKCGRTTETVEDHFAFHKVDVRPLL